MPTTIIYFIFILKKRISAFLKFNSSIFWSTIVWIIRLKGLLWEGNFLKTILKLSICFSLIYITGLAVASQKSQIKFEIFPQNNPGFNDLPTRRVQGIHCDENERIIASTESGVAFSKDYGKTWKTNTVKHGLAANDFIDVFRGENKTVYALSVKSVGLSVSHDDGLTWKVINVIKAPGISDKILLGTYDHLNKIIYVASPYELYRSKDQGLTWEAIGKEKYGFYKSLNVDVNGTLYVLTWDAYSGYIEYSTDQGETFKKHPRIPFKVSGFAVDENLNFLIAYPTYGFKRSFDGGVTWEDVAKNVELTGYIKLSRNPITGNILASVQSSRYDSNDGAVYLTKDFGSDFTQLKNDFTGRNVITSCQNGDVFVGHHFGIHHWSSKNKTWGHILPEGFATVPNVLIGPDGKIYAYTHFHPKPGNSLYISDDLGKTFEVVKGPPIHRLQLMSDGVNVMIGWFGGAYYRDEGKNWTPFYPTNSSFGSLAIDQNDVIYMTDWNGKFLIKCLTLSDCKKMKLPKKYGLPSTVRFDGYDSTWVAAGKEILVTKDQGMTWEKKINLIKDSYLGNISRTPPGAKKPQMVISAYKYIFVSLDDGKTFKTIPASEITPTKNINIHVTIHKDIWYASYFGGISISKDFGETWGVLSQVPGFVYYENPLLFHPSGSFLSHNASGVGWVTGIPIR